MSFPSYSEYKETGLRGPRRIPSHWTTKPVKALAKLINGVPFESSLFSSDEGHPLVRIRDLGKEQVETRYKGDFVPEASIDNQDVLIGMDGDFNVGRWLGEVPALLNQRVCCVRGGNAGLTRYLEYALPAPLKQINEVTYSTTVKHLSSLDILKIKVSLPSSEKEIGQVVAFLDRETAKIDALIAEQQRLIELLQEKRQAVISHAVTKGLNPNVPMKDSGVEWLGEVPEHWVVTPIKHVCKIGNGSTPNKENPAYWQEGHFPWLTSSSVNEGQIYTANAYVTQQALLECSLPIVEPPAVLVGITGQGKTRGMAATLRITCTINQHLAFLKPHSDNARIDFLRSAIDNLYAYFRRDTDGAGSTKGAITCSQLGLYKVAVPPPTEQEEIAASIGLAQSAMSELMKDAERNVELLQERRSALISAAVTGQIDVRGLAQEAAA